MKTNIDIKYNICNFINQKLNETNIANTELAKYLKLGESTIRGYRTHKITPPYSIIPLLADYFNVTIFDVLGLDTSTYLSPEDMELITLNTTNDKFHEIVNKIKDNDELLNAIYTIVKTSK